MLNKEMFPLADKISTYLADYNDFIFHPLKYQFKGFSDDEIIASLDELERNKLAEFHTSNQKKKGMRGQNKEK